MNKLQITKVEFSKWNGSKYGFQEESSSLRFSVFFAVVFNEKTIYEQILTTDLLKQIKRNRVSLSDFKCYENINSYAHQDIWNYITSKHKQAIFEAEIITCQVPETAPRNGHHERLNQDGHHERLNQVQTTCPLQRGTFPCRRNADGIPPQTTCPLELHLGEAQIISSDDFRLAEKQQYNFFCEYLALKAEQEKLTKQLAAITRDRARIEQVLAHFGEQQTYQTFDAIHQIQTDFCDDRKQVTKDFCIKLEDIIDSESRSN